ncbi:hypothetical protein P3T36_004861 [Kitasatospora sp. MAP12-15]|uniref:hypothetical protein n=1 Tax=unclassified Kitasatospora TaxID=2633591 RepID=UPI002472FD57|nr:hypothetical protein [Kitasatospora sp. MAP12-44]MDH6110207.1 hypothetical protein [Kitasatospora sp. MAP12-44]
MPSPTPCGGSMPTNATGSRTAQNVLLEHAGRLASIQPFAEQRGKYQSLAPTNSAPTVNPNAAPAGSWAPTSLNGATS